jgi:hypothetical protein
MSFSDINRSKDKENFINRNANNSTSKPSILDFFNNLHLTFCELIGLIINVFLLTNALFICSTAVLWLVSKHDQKLNVYNLQIASV